MELTIDDIKKRGWLIFEVIVGSKAYGLDTPASDTDIKGIYILPQDEFYGLDYIPQVNNDTNDIVYYELKRFMELMVRSNPNMIELLYSPNDTILYRHPVMDMIDPSMFLSKACGETFANYAFTQVKKAYGLEKKIVNPVEPIRKSVADFCFIRIETESIPMLTFLEMKGYTQGQLGLTRLTHFRDCYNVFYSTKGEYAGVFKKDDSNDVALSHIEKGQTPIAILFFNRDAYSVYCKQYREYWDWVEKRNDNRYQSTVSHGKRYDAKNMMHVFRLLLMAKEIALEKTVHVRRPDKDFLLAIKSGQFGYEELVSKAEQLKNELDEFYQHSQLIDKPEKDKINKLLIEMRRRYYMVD